LRQDNPSEAKGVEDRKAKQPTVRLARADCGSMIFQKDFMNFTTIRIKRNIK
jgi:hypothetical protein